MKQQTQKNKIEWKEVELGSLIKLRGGFAFKSSEFVKEGIPLVRISNFNNDEVDLINSVFISFEEYKKYSELQLKENDLLIAMSGATTGKVGIISKKNIPCILNQRVGKFEILSKNLNWRFLYLFIKSKDFQDEVLYTAGGCAQPNISGKKIESIKILLPFLPNGKPNLEEQEKIVSILEKAEALKLKRKKAGDLLDEYLRSVFYEMFLRENEKYRKITINETAINKKGAIRMGPFGSQLKKNELVDSGVRVLWIENIVNNKFEYSDEKFITPEKFKQLSGFEVYSNNILITMMGTIGRVAIVPREIGKSIISSHLLKIEVNHDRFNSVFLKYLLLTPFVQKQWKKHSHGIVMSGLNTGIIKEAEIFEPPLPLQQKFAQIVEKVEKLKEKQKQSKEEINNLFNSLMQKAFKGELVK